jgi:16S rRNA (cytosine1402-N4)-methyltransferase
MTHTPVLVDEIITLFAPKNGDRLLDATLGLGGHARAYLAAGGNTVSVVGLDADAKALRQAQAELKEFGHRVTFLNANFAHLNDALKGGGIVAKPPLFTHILFDLGLGSHQLSDMVRGFSFKSRGPLSMQYGRLVNLPPAEVAALNYLTKYLADYPDAADLIRELTLTDLAEVIRYYGEERYAGRIARALKETRGEGTAGEIAQAIANAVPAGYEHGRLHPATRTFQALRLAVNRELEALTQALPQAALLLTPGGVMAVISFHSLEDRIVKKFFRTSQLTTLTAKPIRPGPKEIAANPRARSAKLRAVQKM